MVGIQSIGLLISVLSVYSHNPRIRLTFVMFDIGLFTIVSSTMLTRIKFPCNNVLLKVQLDNNREGRVFYHSDSKLLLQHHILVNAKQGLYYDYRNDKIVYKPEKNSSEVIPVVIHDHKNHLSKSYFEYNDEIIIIDRHNLIRKNKYFEVQNKQIANIEL